MGEKFLIYSQDGTLLNKQTTDTINSIHAKNILNQEATVNNTLFKRINNAFICIPE